MYLINDRYFLNIKKVERNFGIIRFKKKIIESPTKDPKYYITSSLAFMIVKSMSWRNEANKRQYFASSCF